MNKDSNIIARALLEANAFIIRPDQPFRLTSGLLAPFYINCRLVLGHAKARTHIADALAKDIENLGVDVVAGGVTAGVPFATLVADRLMLPLAYIRPQPKKHGTGGQIEGASVAGRRVVLVEDLITTATSIDLFAKALRSEGAKTEHISVVFARMTDAAQPILDSLGLHLSVLCDLEHLLSIASKEGFATDKEILEIHNFLRDPEGWSSTH